MLTSSAIMVSAIINAIAITGGLSCGKSEVSNVFRELGAHVVSADEVVHQLLSPDTEVSQQVIALLGDEVLTNQQIDRSKVAQKVFRDAHLLRKLEEIIHPVVLQKVRARCEQVEAKEENPLIIVEVPLLYESGWEELFRAVLVVSAPEEVCCERFCKKTGATPEMFTQRMQQQKPLAEKILLADAVIENNGSKHQLKHDVQKVFHRLCE